MRNTDPAPPPWQPLGSPLPRAPAPPPPPAPPVRGEYGVTEGADGKLKTTKTPKD